MSLNTTCSTPNNEYYFPTNEYLLWTWDKGHFSLPATEDMVFHILFIQKVIILQKLKPVESPSSNLGKSFTTIFSKEDLLVLL
jgi:hypothetical protein